MTKLEGIAKNLKAQLCKEVSGYVTNPLPSLHIFRHGCRRAALGDLQAPWEPQTKPRIATCNFSSMAEALGDLSKLLMSGSVPRNCGVIGQGGAQATETFEKCAPSDSNRLRSWSR